MEQYRALDLEPLANVELSDGKTLELYPLTTTKVIKIAKFIAVDGMKIYGQFQDTLNNPELSDVQKVTTVVSELTDEQIIHILAILLDMNNQQALKIDPFDTLEIITAYVENIDVEKAFTNVRKLVAKFRGNQTTGVNQPMTSGMIGSN